MSYTKKVKKDVDNYWQQEAERLQKQCNEYLDKLIQLAEERKATLSVQLAMRIRGKLPDLLAKNEMELLN